MDAQDEADGLKRLAEQVGARRVALDMSKLSVARAAGISINTYQRLEAAVPVRDVTYAKIEEVLGWARGSCVEVIRGGEPIVIAGRSGGLAIAAVPEGDLTDAVQSAFIAVSDDLTAAQIRDLSSKVVEELKRRGKL